MPYQADSITMQVIRYAMEQVAEDLDMTLELERGEGDNRHRPKGRSHVTVLGTPLTSAAMAAVAGRIADTGANIDRIERMARYPVTAIDLHVSGVDPDKLRGILAREAADQEVDIAVQAANLLRRSMRLIVMDVDSTLIQGEVIEMLAAHAGCEAEVAAITEQAMRGEIDFAASLRARVERLAGVDASALDQVYEELELAPGARTTVRTLKRLGYRFERGVDPQQVALAQGSVEARDPFPLAFAGAAQLDVALQRNQAGHHRGAARALGAGEGGRG